MSETNGRCEKHAGMMRDGSCELGRILAPMVGRDNCIAYDRPEALMFGFIAYDTKPGSPENPVKVEISFPHLYRIAKQIQPEFDAWQRACQALKAKLDMIAKAALCSGIGRCCKATCEDCAKVEATRS